MQLLKIKFLVAASGKKTIFQKGEVYSLPPDEAKSFLYAKIAVPVKESREKKIIKAEETRNVQTDNSTSGRTVKPDRSESLVKGVGDSGGRSDNKSDSKRKATRRKSS